MGISALLKLGNKEQAGFSLLGAFSESRNSPTRLKTLFGITESETAVTQSSEEDTETMKSQDLISLGITLLICLTGGLEVFEDLDFACPHQRMKHAKSLDESKSVRTHLLMTLLRRRLERQLRGSQAKARAAALRTARSCRRRARRKSGSR